MEIRSAERKVRERKMNEDRQRPLIQQSADDDIRLLHCGFQDLEIAAGTADLVLTDPPYQKESLHLWNALGAFAADVLRPGGFLVTYAGSIYLDQIMAALGRHLTYFWQVILLHAGGRLSIYERHIHQHYKPILLFMKEPVTPGPWLNDVLQGAGKEKHLHDWQQSVTEAA
jgi:hypothetical protein